MSLLLHEGDYCADGCGGVQELTGAEAAAQRILFRLTVRRGSFPFMPELGSQLYRLGRESIQRREQAALQYVTEALAEETEVSVEGVQLCEGAEGESILHLSLCWQGQKLELPLTVS